MDIEALIRDVRDAAGEVDACIQAVEDARRSLHRSALKALMAVSGDRERERALVAALYWEVRAVPVKTLEAVVGSAAQVRALAGPGPLLGDCDVCATPVHATSRSNLATGVARCKPCEARRRLSRTPVMPGSWDDEVPSPDPPPEWEDDVSWEDAWSDERPWGDAPPWEEAPMDGRR